MKLTPSMLIQAGMPPWDVNKFKHLFGPDGCDVTVGNWGKANKAGLAPEYLFHAICTPDQAERWYKLSDYPSTDQLKRDYEARLEEYRQGVVEKNRLARVALMIEALGGNDEIHP